MLVKQSFIRCLIGLTMLAMMAGCHQPKKTYLIGVDPAWYSLQLMGKEANVSAFTTELLREISHLEKVEFKRVNKNWDTLFDCLHDQDCQAVITSFYPHAFHLSDYHFSDLFLQTGPVLVVREQTTLQSLDRLKGKEVVVDSQANKALLIQQYPGVIVRYYHTIPEALNQLINDVVDAVLIDVILAKAFVQNLYLGKVKVASQPLSDEGLRLVTLPEEDPQLIEAFNAGFKKMQKNGKYEELLKKWDLIPRFSQASHIDKK